MSNQDEENRIVNAEANKNDQQLDLTLRPEKFKDYIGQEKTKENLSISIQAANKRGEALDHVLLYGAPGLGKTTLAHVIAKEIGSNIKITSGPAIEKAGDLAAILTNLEEKDILFIDEIHRLNKTIEEVLYPAMEDYALDIVMGKGPSAKSVRLDLSKFTIIGATTKASLLSAPLRDRFGLIYHLNFYEEDEINKILHRSANILGVNMEQEAAWSIAKRSRQTPRIANRLLKRVRDYCEVKGDGVINTDICTNAFDMLEVDELGLDQIDRKVIETIIHKFNGGPVGVNTLAAATGEDMSTIEDMYEPYLMQLGFLKRSKQGRIATSLAYRHLGVEPPQVN